MDASSSSTAASYHPEASRYFNVGAERFQEGEVDAARDQFDRALQLDSTFAVSIADLFSSAADQASEAADTSAARSLHRTARHYLQAASSDAVDRGDPVVLSRLGDELQALSHLSRNGYDKSANKEAEHYYVGATIASPEYYPAHLGRLTTLLDRFNASKHSTRLLGSSQPDVRSFNEALAELGAVLEGNPAPDALEAAEAMFKEPIDAVGESMVLGRVVPAMHNALLEPSIDAAALGALFGAFQTLLAEQPWSGPHVFAAVHAYVDAGRVDENTLYPVLEMYAELSTRLPNHGVELVADMATLRRTLQVGSTDALQRFIDNYTALIGDHLGEATAVNLCIEELGAIIEDNPRRNVFARAGKKLLIIGQKYPSFADPAFQRIAGIAKDMGEPMVSHARTDFTAMLRSGVLPVRSAAGQALQLLGAGEVLKKMYEEEAVRNITQGPLPA